MDAGGRAVVHLLLLAMAVQVVAAQHWSYGWLPGGKRSVGELEATIRMMGTGSLLSPPEQASVGAEERRRPYDVIYDDSGDFGRKKSFPYQ